MVNEKIYNVNWKTLLLWLMPAPLRRIALMKWLLVITEPVQQLHGRLLLQRAFYQYWLGINSQVCYLKKMLNDRYDPVLRRIYILRPTSFLPAYIFLRAEQKPVYVFTKAESKPLILYTRNETDAGGVDFYVVVPAGLAANFIEMNVLINKNKLPAKEHAIKTI